MPECKFSSQARQLILKAMEEENMSMKDMASSLGVDVATIRVALYSNKPIMVSTLALMATCLNRKIEVSLTNIS